MRDCNCEHNWTETDIWLANNIGSPILRWLDEHFAPHLEKFTIWLASVVK